MTKRGVIILFLLGLFIISAVLWTVALYNQWPETYVIIFQICFYGFIVLTLITQSIMHYHDWRESKRMSKKNPNSWFNH